MEFKVLVAVLVACVCCVVGRPTDRMSVLLNKLASGEQSTTESQLELESNHRSRRSISVGALDHAKHEIIDLNGTSYDFFQKWCTKWQILLDGTSHSTCEEYAEAEVTELGFPTIPDLSTLTPQATMETTLAALHFFERSVSAIDFMEPCLYDHLNDECTPYYQCRNPRDAKFSLYCESVDLKINMDKLISDMKGIASHTAVPMSFASSVELPARSSVDNGAFHAASVYWVHALLDNAGKAIKAHLSSPSTTTVGSKFAQP